MIILTATDSNPEVRNTIMTVLEGQSVPFVTDAPALDFCLCNFECEYEAPVFGIDKQGGIDTSSVVFKKQIPTDSIVWSLLKDGVNIATLNNNALGTYYPTFESQPDQLGFVLNWNTVLTTHGPGVYQIQAVRNQLGSVSTTLSYKFDLMPFTEEMANNTVKIDTYQNGNIKSSPIDYTGMNWLQSIRIRGTFGDKQPKLEINNFKSSTYEKQQIRDIVTNEYTLTTELLIADVANKLIYDCLLGNKVLVSDYRLFNQEIYRNIPLVWTGIESNHKQDNTKSTFNFIFEDRTDNNIKTNY